MSSENIKRLAEADKKASSLIEQARKERELLRAEAKSKAAEFEKTQQQEAEKKVQEYREKKAQELELIEKEVKEQTEKDLEDIKECLSHVPEISKVFTEIVLQRSSADGTNK